MATATNEVLDERIAARKAKGVEALIDKEPKPGRYMVVPASIIEIDKGFNNRRELGDIKELAESIRSVGLLEPLLVWLQLVPGTSTEPKGYVHVIAGHRRLAAAREAGLVEIPVIIVDLDERGRMEALLVENLHRKDIDALEEADGYKRLIDLGLSQSQVAKKVGRSQAHVSKRMALLALVPDAIKIVNSGGMALDSAIELAKLEPGLQADVLAQEKKSVREGDRYFEYGSPANLAQRITIEREQEARRAAAKAQAKKEGVELLKGQIYEHSWYSRSERPLGSGRDQVKVGLKEHRALKCHRAYISQDGKLKYACADPASHMSKKDAEAFKAQHSRSERNDYAKQDAERKARREELDAIRAGRDNVVKQALAKLDRTTATTFALESLIVRTGERKQTKLLDLLGAPGVQLAEYCNKSDANLLRASVALSYLLGVEAIDRQQTYGEYGIQFESTLQWLKSIGYEPAPAELALLEDVQQRRAEDAVVEDSCKRCGRSIQEAYDDYDAEDESDEASFEAYNDSDADFCFTCWKAGLVTSPEVLAVDEAVEQLTDELTLEDLGDQTRTITEPGAESTQTAEVPPDNASDGGSAAPAPNVGQPVSQHVCRSCGTREGPWAEMVDIGWLCSNCEGKASAPAATTPEPAGPVDQRARRV